MQLLLVVDMNTNNTIPLESEYPKLSTLSPQQLKPYRNHIPKPFFRHILLLLDADSICPNQAIL